MTSLSIMRFKQVTNCTNYFKTSTSVY